MTPEHLNSEARSSSKPASISGRGSNPAAPLFHFEHEVTAIRIGFTSLHKPITFNQVQLILAQVAEKYLPDKHRVPQRTKAS